MTKYIKWIFVLAFIAFVCWAVKMDCANQAHGYGIVNNSGTTSEDSINVNVLCLDSLGRPTTCDSFYVVVFKSGTNAVAFRDSGTIAMAGLDSTVIGGRTAYYYHRAVADIDGGGATGQYAGKIISITDAADLPFESPFTFQVVSWELDDQVGLVDDINTKTTNLPADPADDSDIDGQLSTIDGNVDNIVLYTDGDGSDGIDADINTIMGYLDADSSDGIDPIILQIRQIATNIKTKTDNLPTDPADDSDIDGQLTTIAGYLDADSSDGIDPIILETRQIANNIKTVIDKLTFTSDTLVVGLVDSAITIDKIKNYTFENAQLCGSWLSSAKIANGAFLGTKFGAAFLTADKIGTDAITAAKIKDDAIDYGTFAATAPTAWWNEGKTGYSLSSPQTFDLTGDITGNLSGSVGSVTGAVGSVTGAVGSVTGAVGSVTGNVGGSVASVTADVGITQAGADKVWGTGTRALTDKANFTLASTEWANVWTDIDTAATIDTSDIGDWFINNSSADFTAGQRDTIKWAYRIVVDSLADPTDVWTDIDTTATIDTSDIGVWLVNNLSGLDDSSAGDISYIANTPADYKADVSDLASIKTVTDKLKFDANDSLAVRVYGFNVGARSLLETEAFDALTSYAPSSHSAANVWTVGTRDLTTFKWTIIDTDYDTATHDFSNTKVVLADSSAGDISYIANTPADFKATGFATHSAADAADAVWDEARAGHTTGNTFGGDALDNDVWTDAKAGYLDEAVSGIDDNPWDNADSDTASGMGDWFADWFNAGLWVTATGFSTFDYTTDEVKIDSTSKTETSNRVWNDDYNAYADRDIDSVRVVGDAGAGQKNTEAEITGWVKATLEDTSDIARDATKDDYKDGVGGGTGSNQVTIRVKSSTDSAAIPGATIAVWNSDQTALMGLLASNTDAGMTTFALNNGTYNLRIQKYKFQWTVPITIGVSGNKDTTVYATEFTPSPPPSADMVTVYGYIDSVGLVGQRAQISCTIYEQELRYETKLLAYYSYTKTVYANASGYWEMFLYANEDLTPAGTMYEFTIKTPFQPVLRKWVTVPTPGPWEFTF